MSDIMLIAECHYAECHYAECHYADCHYAECDILFIITLCVVVLNVVMLNVVTPLFSIWYLSALLVIFSYNWVFLENTVNTFKFNSQLID